MTIIAILTAFLTGIIPPVSAAVSQAGAGDVAALVRDMRSNEETVHRPAYERLLALGPRAAAAVPALMEMLDLGTFFWDGAEGAHGSVPHSEHAAAVLAAIGRPALDRLLARIRSADPPGSMSGAGGRTWALRALSRIPDPRTDAALETALDDRSSDVRGAAADILAAAASPGALDRLARRMAGPESEGRDAAAWVLIRKKDARAWPYLESRIKSPYYDIRLEGVALLGEFGDARAAEALAHLRAKDEHAEVRKAAAAALAALRNEGKKH